MTVEHLSYGLVGLLLTIVGWQYVELRKKETEAVTKLQTAMGELTTAMTDIAQLFNETVSELKQRIHDQEFRCEHKIGCRFEAEVRNGTVIIKDRRERPRDRRVATRRGIEDGDAGASLEG